MAGTKREGEREKAFKGKGKGAPAIRASVFVFCPPISRLIR